MTKDKTATTEKKSKKGFSKQDKIIFAGALIAILFAIWQIVQAQVRVSHADWPIYSNEEGQFSFRYPEEWGTPEVRQFDFPDRPNYTYLVFPNAGHVSFGGSLDGYEHPGRIVAPTDDPGFVRAEDNQFYTPGNSSKNRLIPANRLSLVEGIDAKCLYNYQEYEEAYQSAFGIIRCNLSYPPYNGVNFVIANPDDHNKDLKLLYEVISTFQKSVRSS